MGVEDEEQGNLQQRDDSGVAADESHIGEVDAVGVTEDEIGKPIASDISEPAPEPTTAQHIITRDYNNNEHRPTGRKNKLLIVAIGILATLAIALAVILGITLQQQPSQAQEQDVASNNINVDANNNNGQGENDGGTATTFADEFEGEPT